MRNYGQMEEIGSVIRRCLEASETQFYRPQRPFNHKRKKPPKPDSQQLSLRFTEPVRDFDLEFSEAKPSRLPNPSLITPDNPITDEDVPF